MPFQASSDFFKNGLLYLSSQITRLAVCTSSAITLDSTVCWGDRICGSTAASLVGSPGSTTNGWTVSVTSTTAMSVDSSGKAFHVALFSSKDVKYVTECTSKNIGGSDTVTVPVWNVRIADPTSS